MLAEWRPKLRRDGAKMVARSGSALGIQEAFRSTGSRLGGIGSVPEPEAGWVLASIGDALILTDLSGRITYLNAAAVRLTGWDEEEATGRPLDVVLPLVSESSGEPVVNTASRCLAEGRTVDLEEGVVLIRRDGSEVAIGDSASPVRNEEGQVIGVVLVIQDEREKRRIGRRLSYEASHDALTGMPNRREFDRRLARLVAELEENSANHALLVIDLDGFKAVNDSGGHDAGDALLARLGPLLSCYLRHDDLLARLGGDEFGVILEDCTLPDAERVAEALRAAVHGYHLGWGGQVHSVTASIGLVPLVPHAGDAAKALRAADAACYAAKAAGGNRVHRGTPAAPKRRSTPV